MIELSITNEEIKTLFPVQLSLANEWLLVNKKNLLDNGWRDDEIKVGLQFTKIDSKYYKGFIIASLEILTINYGCKVIEKFEVLPIEIDILRQDKETVLLFDRFLSENYTLRDYLDLTSLIQLY